MGGWNGSRCLNDLQEFSSTSHFWFEVLLTSGPRPSQKYRLESICDENNIVIFGGVNSKKDRFNDLSIFETENKEYINIPAKGDVPTGRSFHRLLMVDSMLFMFGGLDGERQNDLYVLKLDLQLAKVQNKNSQGITNANVDNIDAIENFKQATKMSGKSSGSQSDREFFAVIYPKFINF